MSVDGLGKKYNHLQTEAKFQQYWQDNKTYKWNSHLPREKNFVIDTPPPTVSGLLHMGHVFSYVQADFIARYMRMQGKNVFYPMGFDDNGLPTERLVEKTKKIKGSETNRDDFIRECHDVIEKAEEQFENLFNSIALSVDWEQKYQTISKQSCHISQLSFLDLYEKKEVYRKPEPTIWDTIDSTALAQADLVDKEVESSMNEIIFKTVSGKDIVIATTRPEMLAACVAVFFHPQDKRYEDLHGEKAIVPVFNYEVPIISDDKVEQDKGTGLVMCCTFGDKCDIEWWKKHKLPLRIIIDKKGKILENIATSLNFQ